MARNWRTTVAGACLLLAVVVRVAMAAAEVGFLPALLAAAEDATTQASVVAGLGLLLAKDGQVSGPS